jgi:hypothetical protein
MTSVRALVEANHPVPAGDLVANAPVGTAAATASVLIGAGSAMAPHAVATALVAIALVAEKRAVVAVLAIAPVGVPQAVLAAGPVAVQVFAEVQVPPVPSHPAVNGALMGRSAEELARAASAFLALRAARRAAVMPRADRSVVVRAPKDARS